MKEPIILPVGMIGTNCYILGAGDTGVVIDPGDEAEKILAVLKKEGITPRYILLTHGHFDHIGAVQAVREATGAEVVIGKNDREQLDDTEKSLGRAGDPRYQITPGREVEEGDTVTCGELRFLVLDTPGHTRGGVCYLCGDMLFSGDTLFRGDVGRTDLYGGDYPTLRLSLQKLAALDDAIKVYPGHGEQSTMEYEKKHNPYLGKADYDDLY